VTTSTDSNPWIETGAKTKQVNRAYYITRIQNDGNLYIIFIEYDQKAKEIIPNHYKIVAIGERNYSGTLDDKFGSGNIFDCQEASDEHTSKDEPRWTLELCYMYRNYTDKNGQHLDSKSTESSAELVTSILKEMIEW